jgi:hypothetical protein
MFRTAPVRWVWWNTRGWNIPPSDPRHIVITTTGALSPAPTESDSYGNFFADAIIGYGKPFSARALKEPALFQIPVIFLTEKHHSFPATALKSNSPRRGDEALELRTAFHAHSFLFLFPW